MAWRFHFPIRKYDFKHNIHDYIYSKQSIIFMSYVHYVRPGDVVISPP